MLVVDDRPDLHVFMQRRNPAAIFGGGAFVFPGGAVDAGDLDPRVLDRIVGIDDAAASRLQGVARGGLRHWVAAAREAFEEAGLLIGGPARPGDLLEADRAALNAGALGFADVLERHDVVLDLSDTHLLSHWLTPRGAPRRYDTWFLVTAAVPGQEGAHDDAEAVHSEWVRPSDALARFAAGEIDLVFPTMRTLVLLERFGTAAALLDAVRAANGDRSGPPLVMSDASGEHVVLPGCDPSAARRAWRPLDSRPELDREVLRHDLARLGAPPAMLEAQFGGFGAGPPAGDDPHESVA